MYSIILYPFFWDKASLRSSSAKSESNPKVLLNKWRVHCMVPPLCRTPLEMESRKMFPWCDLDILRALWRSTMFPCQRQCRRQESGKVGIPVSNHNPQLLFGPHPAQSQSTQRLPYSDPDRFQLLFALTHFVSLWFQEPENVWVPWKQLEAMQNAANLAFAQLFPAPVCPNTKLSGRNSWPKGPARTLSMVPATTSVGLKQSGQQHKNLRAYSGFGYQECWQMLLQWDINSIQFLHQTCVSVLPKVIALRQLRCTYWKHLESCLSFAVVNAPGSRSIRTARGT